MTDREFRCRLAPEDELGESDHAAISDLLVAAFPQYADIFSRSSFWGARPEYRLWLETPEGRMVAHLDLERRIIGVGEVEVLVAGVGEVATHPDYQGQGLGRRLMSELQRVLRTIVPVEFGYLNCREAVVGFYTSTGWHRLGQPARFFEPDTREWIEYEGPKLILPALAPLDRWPDRGVIDLRGMPW